MARAAKEMSRRQRATRRYVVDEDFDDEADIGALIAQRKREQRPSKHVKRSADSLATAAKEAGLAAESAISSAIGKADSAVNAAAEQTREAFPSLLNEQKARVTTSKYGENIPATWPEYEEDCPGEMMPTMIGYGAYLLRGVIAVGLVLVLGLLFVEILFGQDNVRELGIYDYVNPAQTGESTQLKGVYDKGALASLWGQGARANKEKNTAAYATATANIVMLVVFAVFLIYAIMDSMRQLFHTWTFCDTYTPFSVANVEPLTALLVPQTLTAAAIPFIEAKIKFRGWYYAMEFFVGLVALIAKLYSKPGEWYDIGSSFFGLIYNWWESFAKDVRAVRNVLTSSMAQDLNIAQPDDRKWGTWQTEATP